MAELDRCAEPRPNLAHARCQICSVEKSRVRVVAGSGGPYRVVISLRETSIIFTISGEDEAEPLEVALPTRGFRRVIKDYFMICDSYFQAIKGATPSRIEAIDMARRGLHNEGSEHLRDALQGRIEIDHDTARRLFTLVCVLHIRG